MILWVNNKQTELGQIIEISEYHKFRLWIMKLDVNNIAVVNYATKVLR